jgi:hypothetical protein
MTDLERFAWSQLGVGAGAVATGITGIQLSPTTGWVMVAVGLVAAIVLAIARDGARQ